MGRSLKCVAGWLLVLGATSAALAQNAATKIYLLRDEEKRQWCLYATESAWESDRDSIGAQEVASLAYRRGALTEVDVTYSDETGDWTVYDRYFIGPSKRVVKLARKSNILPGDRSVEEIFAITDDRARRRSVETRSLTTGKPKTSQDTETWLPGIDVITRFKDFPFYRLIARKYSSASFRDKSCVTETQPSR